MTEEPNLRTYAQVYDAWKAGLSVEDAAKATGRDPDYVRHAFAKYQAKADGTWEDESEL
jgi:hypothetical protein